MLQPLGFIGSLSAKAELALKLISRTVTEGEAGKQLTVKTVTALPLRSAHRDEPVLLTGMSPFCGDLCIIRSSENMWNGFLITTDNSVVRRSMQFIHKRILLKKLF